MAIALVTGASRGIGRATALALGEAGFALGLLARSRSGLEETVDLLHGRGAAALAVVADVTQPDEVRGAVVEIEARLDGSIEALVNNAGSMLAIGPLWEVEPSDWWEDVHSSLGGAYNCCRELVPRMIAAGGGRIVNLTSYAASRPAPYQTGYAAAKAGLASLTESLAASLEPHNVQVFSVAPGFTDTAMTRALRESPAGRRWMPEAGERGSLDAESSARLIVRLVTGGADALSGRFLHALDDVDELLARLAEIRRDDLYAVRLRRLAATS